MPAALDPRQERVANLRRRASMLERHEAAHDPVTGKSKLAVAAGRLGGQRTAERHGGGSAWGLRMALRRWHGVEISETRTNKKAVSRANDRRPKGGSDEHNSPRRP